MKTKNNNLNISKAGKVMMFVALISALVMYFNVYLDAIGYFFSIQFGNWLAGNAHQDMTWEAIPQFQSVMNWILVLILTVLSVIFLIKDKKGQKDIRVYEWYIRAGVLHILIGILGLDGIVGLPSMIYSITTFVLAIKNKKNDEHGLNAISNNAIVICSTIAMVLMVLMAIGILTH